MEQKKKKRKNGKRGETRNRIFLDFSFFLFAPSSKFWPSLGRRDILENGIKQNDTIQNKRNWSIKDIVLNFVIKAFLLIVILRSVILVSVNHCCVIRLSVILQSTTWLCVILLCHSTNVILEESFSCVIFCLAFYS